MSKKVLLEDCKSCNKSGWVDITKLVQKEDGLKFIKSKVCCSRCFGAGKVYKGNTIEVDKDSFIDNNK